jgi:NAD+ kinase
MSRISRVGLVAKGRLGEAAGVITELADWLEGRGVRPVYESDTAGLARLSGGAPTFSRDELPRQCDLVVVLGGDGTFIGMADRIADAGTDVPILGVNFGSLGFLTEITLNELYGSLESVLDGRAQIDERLMLRSRIRRGDETLVERLALNDIVINRGALSRIIDLVVAVGGQPVMRVRADGLIIASPTGSTAYNLAAGGPIVHPAVDALLLTPIAPHMLTNRPIVIPASAELRVEPAQGASNDELYVTIDGQFGHPLQAGEVVFVHRAERPLRLVRAATRTYFDVLREKLKWSER